MTASNDLDLEPTTFESRDGFIAVGCAGEFLPGQTGAIGALWGRFSPRIGEIAHRIEGATYGICCPPEGDAADPRLFTYVAAVAVTEATNPPAGMLAVTVPAKRCAVFAYDGGIGPALPDTMEAIFGKWLPASDYAKDGVDFEYYTDEFDGETGTGRFYIYVPVCRPGD